MLRRRCVCGIYDAATNLLAVEHGRGVEMSRTTPHQAVGWAVEDGRVADEGIGGKSSNRVLQGSQRQGRAAKNSN